MWSRPLAEPQCRRRHRVRYSIDTFSFARSSRASVELVSVCRLCSPGPSTRPSVRPSACFGSGRWVEKRGGSPNDHVVVVVNCGAALLLVPLESRTTDGSARCALFETAAQMAVCARDRISCASLCDISATGFGLRMLYSHLLPDGETPSCLSPAS